jgi:hypothetical protein
LEVGATVLDEVFGVSLEEITTAFAAPAQGR